MTSKWRRLSTILAVVSTLGLVAVGSAAHSAGPMRVTLLGTGTPVPSPERFGYSTLIEAGGQKLIFDFGRGITIRLAQLKIPFGSINAHFLTQFLEKPRTHSPAQNSAKH